MEYRSTTRRSAPRGRRPLRGAAAVALLALGPMAAPAHAASPEPSASPSAEPTALPEITALKVPDDPCVSAGSDVVAEAPWTHHALGLTEAHELSRGSGTTVAVLATAVDDGAGALSGAVAGASTDCLGFGSFLAGVAAARTEPGSGFVGVAPGARITAVATGERDSGLTSAGQIASGITDAVAADADVILVGTAALAGSAALDEAVAAAVAADAVVVAPATAQGPDGPVPGHPAQNPDVLSVASHDVAGVPVLEAPLMGEDDEPARVDVIAPGDRVMGVGPGGDGHFVSAGDGVAAAFAAGAAALLRSHAPDLTGAQVRERLTSTAYASPGGASDPLAGHGRIDPLAALTGRPAAGDTRVPGEEYVPDPSPRGSVEAATTAAVVGAAGFVVVFSALAGAVLRRGRARRWRPAAASERPPDIDTRWGPGGTSGDRP
ncbi:S8 family serine peptidase [Marinitenerispora sediminis]|uniref:Peptidase S8 and S53 subtilisin kexin sedolisin n=1 Tax=Marinitenerispora sediminis TaxID=1931232 RepID=A0A368T2U0_9ACTN|nr:S8 family serine peptidase [Marinitenerispora sediminis]RCV49278.1 peptidase S8 and S53 subtilisin kexin sedolisin [Marinitenerispora sediminis]RCV56188.1 peptidase S8 and S53 subtilisin kexin sedolisin [Marinitenerispora sediminis]RCV57477.1 peptidase S8 and S53 subtilisin kexin sedolisin [Marinitenerispora sediminis]